MTAAGDGGRPKVRRLQPLRVLLSGHDRRFLRVTSFLLSRRGYAVVDAGTDDPARAADRERADVVLLEPDGSRAAAARTVAALQALPRAPAILLAVDDGERGRWEGVPTVLKWAPLETLAEEIEAASRRRVAPLSGAAGTLH